MKIKSLFCFMVLFATCAHADTLSKEIFVSKAWVQAMPATYPRKRAPASVGSARLSDDTKNARDPRGPGRPEWRLVTTKRQIYRWPGAPSRATPTWRW